MFDNTLRSIVDCGLTYLHVFPYSSRPGTPASRMPAVPGPIIKKRAALLREKGKEALYHFYKSCVNQDTQLLVETSEKKEYGMRIRGKTDHFAPIELESPIEYAIGSVIKAHVVEATSEGLKGKIIE